MRTAICPDCKSERMQNRKGVGPISVRCWPCTQQQRGNGPTMPPRSITLEQAAASFLGALSHGYGDGEASAGNFTARTGRTMDTRYAPGKSGRVAKRKAAQ